jgi:hypothetical protein
MGKYGAPVFHTLGGEQLWLRPRWDFQSSFPHPTDEALAAGILQEEDMAPDNLRALHDEHARELLGVLHDLDAVQEARRLGVDPATGRRPATPVALERLQKLYVSESRRLECQWRGQMAAYESAFGSDAANAFAEAIRGWHTGRESGGTETPPTLPATALTAHPSFVLAPLSGHP